MSSSRTRPDHPVVLPSSPAWSADTRLVGEVLATVGSAAACTSDDTRHLQPTLTWQIAAEVVGDCATTDHDPDRVRALPLRGYALDAVWACHAALLQAAGTTPDSDDDAGPLAGLLAHYLYGLHSDTEVRDLIGAVERILAVLSLDLPAARTLITHLVLNPDVGPEARSAYADVQAAWRRAGVAC